MDKRKKSIDERLWSKCDRTESGCLVFARGRICWDGYGQVSHEGKTMKAHRVSWSVTNGPIPPGMMVLHKCDVRSCVEPSHLFLGDAKLNMADMVSKGRDRARRGESHGNAKLNWGAVERIRSFRGPAKEIASDLGVSLQCVYHVRWGKTWQSPRYV